MYAIECTAGDSDEDTAVVRKEKRLNKGKLFQKTSSKTHQKSAGMWLASYPGAQGGGERAFLNAWVWG